MLAAISDKVPTVSDTLMFGVALGGAALLLGWFRSWLGVLPAIVAGLYDYIGLAELQDPMIGSMVMEELGWPYVIRFFAALNGPLLVAWSVLIMRSIHKRRGKRRTTREGGQ
ncbi:MAG: hypothetical protein ACYS8X_09145 [Planctomycetota bacterium]|jgi:hypothetical protein